MSTTSAQVSDTASAAPTPAAAASQSNPPPRPEMPGFARTEPTATRPISPGFARQCPEMPGSARPLANAQNEPTATPASTPSLPSPLPRHPLSPRHLTAARLLLTHSPAAVCRHLRIDPKTLYRWRQHPAFQSELQRLHHTPSRPQAQSPTPQHPTPPGTPRLPHPHPGDARIDALLKQYGFR